MNMKYFERWKGGGGEAKGRRGIKGKQIGRQTDRDRKRDRQKETETQRHRHRHKDRDLVTKIYSF